MARGVAMISLPAICLAAQNAQAHMFGAQGAGFAAGVVHPFIGLDHLAAMLAVGLWAAQLGGVALWRVPAAFVVTMAAGAGLAFTGTALPSVETGIAASLLVLGLLIGFAARLPTAASILLTGVFALFHGYAHGAELPQAATPIGYALGFVFATLTLHGLGLFAGSVLHGRAAWLLRAAGVVIAGGGLGLLAS